MCLSKLPNDVMPTCHCICHVIKQEAKLFLIIQLQVNKTWLFCLFFFFVFGSLVQPCHPYTYSSKLVEMRSQFTQPVWFYNCDVPHIILVGLDNIIEHHPEKTPKSYNLRLIRSWEANIHMMYNMCTCITGTDCSWINVY